MDWTVVAGGIAALVSLVNIFISNRIKSDVAEVKLHVITKLVEQDKETREWADKEFAKKEVVDVRFDALKCSHRG